jgi:hypothetical protein
MKKIIVVLAVLATSVAATSSSADTYIKQASHTDEYYYGGNVTPEDNSEIEMWFGEKKMAYFTSNRIIVIDAEKDALVFANKLDSTYVETSLPFEWSNVVDEGTLGYLARYKTEGTVKKTELKKSILGRECTCYRIETWIESEGERFNQREEMVWVTTDLSIDWEVYDKLTKNSMKLQNYDDTLIEAFSVLKGIALETVADVYLKGFSVKSVEEVLEITEIQPDTDVYALPSYFRKKDQLTMADLRG